MPLYPDGGGADGSGAGTAAPNAAPGATEASRHDFILKNTRFLAAPLTPEIGLYVASEDRPLWHKSEEEIEADGLSSPFWAFAWAGGQALARHILDNPGIVRGKAVMDFAAGSGLVAIAAAKAGAFSVAATEIDPFACTAMRLNAQRNGVDFEIIEDDVVGRPKGGCDVFLAGDICYEARLAERVETWLRTMQEEGAAVLIGDPGRTYLPKPRLQEVARYRVKTQRMLEDTDVHSTGVWTFAA